MKIESSVFSQGQAMPKRYTGDAEDVSPPLQWSGLPAGARQLALIVDDPDAPTPEPWVHWVIYAVSPHCEQLPQGIATDAAPPEPAGAMQGKNSWNTLGYRGPAPPPGSGPHHYHFNLYALDAQLELPDSLDKNSLLAAMKGHIVGQAELVGTYER